VTGETKQPGLYFVTPFIQGVEQMDVQLHIYEVAATAASKDMQNAHTKVAVNFGLDPAHAVETYSQMRRDYVARIVNPSVQEAVKSVTAKYDASDLITQRAAVRDAIEAALKVRMEKHHLILDQVSITDFSFDEAFAQAIEQKQVATQNALRAENEVREAKFNADARIATARGEAEAIRIQVEAIRTQGGAEYVQLKAIEAWAKGGSQVPQYVMGGNAIPFLNLKLGEK
jgi:regulator of protease activity HflC (stomatin/prohibitin superfamily)